MRLEIADQRRKMNFDALQENMKRRNKTATNFKSQRNERVQKEVMDLETVNIKHRKHIEHKKLQINKDRKEDIQRYSAKNI